MTRREDAQAALDAGVPAPAGPVPFTYHVPAPDCVGSTGAPGGVEDAISDGIEAVTNARWRAASDRVWPSLRFTVPVPALGDEVVIVVKQWVNDWWPPVCPDLNLRRPDGVRYVPACADLPEARVPSGPAFWVHGLEHHGTEGLMALLHGTNTEVYLPDGLSASDPMVVRFLSRLTIAGHGPRSWLERAYHPKRDVPERGWGDGMLTAIRWHPWLAAPEDPGCPAPDVLDVRRLPAGWLADATGARTNPRLDHAERQWVVTEPERGNPVLWARALPIASRHRIPLVVRADTRYRLDWEETPIGWVGSLDAELGHHVVLLERGDIRIEAWFGLEARMTRREAALAADRLFG